MFAKRCSTIAAILLAVGGTAHAQSSLPSTVKIYPITDATEARETLSQIKDDLKQFAPSAKLIDCSNLVDYIEDMPSGHDSSFGAVCNIEIRGAFKRLTLCDDRMVGKFFESDEVIEAAERIGLFVRAHCPPGG